MGTARHDPAVVTQETIEFEGVDRSDPDTYTRTVQRNRNTPFVYLPQVIGVMNGIQAGDDVVVKVQSDGILILPDGGDE